MAYNNYARKVFFSNKILRFVVCPMVYNLISSASVVDPIVCAWNAGVISRLNSVKNDVMKPQLMG